MTAKATKSVRLVARISGTRDGNDWPAPGEIIDLPADEANQLLSSGAAVDPSLETATAPGGVETATTRGNQPLRTAAQSKADADAQAAAKAQADADAAEAAAKLLEDQAKETAAAADAEAKADAAAAKKAAAK